MNDTFIRNITKIKKVAAKVNGKHGYIKLEISQTIDKACVKILNGRFQTARLPRPNITHTLWNVYITAWSFCFPKQSKYLH